MHAAAATTAIPPIRYITVWLPSSDAEVVLAEDVDAAEAVEEAAAVEDTAEVFWANVVDVPYAVSNPERSMYVVVNSLSESVVTVVL